MRKSTRGRPPKKNANTKSKKNTKDVTEQDVPNDDDETKNNDIIQEDKKKTTIVEEKKLEPPSKLSPIPSRSSSTGPTKVLNVQKTYVPDKAIRFNFGTGKTFISNNDPKKEFTESIFTSNQKLQSNSSLINKNISSKTTINEKIDDSEPSPSILDTTGQTGEEDEERLFESQAILYTLQMKNEESQNNLDSLKFKTPHFPIQKRSKSRPSTPFSNFSSNISRTSSTNNKSDSTNSAAKDKESENHQLTRTSSSPNSEFVEVGRGDLHLNKGHGFYRLVMRRAQIGKVCLNMRLFNDMNPKEISKCYTKFIGYQQNPDKIHDKDSNTELKYGIYMLRFKNEEIQNDFFTKMTGAIADLNKK